MCKQVKGNNTKPCTSLHSKIQITMTDMTTLKGSVKLQCQWILHGWLTTVKFVLNRTLN